VIDELAVSGVVSGTTAAIVVTGGTTLGCDNAVNAGGLGTLLTEGALVAP
jgi:hypothetical protein